MLPSPSKNRTEPTGPTCSTPPSVTRYVPKPNDVIPERQRQQLAISGECDAVNDTVAAKVSNQVPSIRVAKFDSAILASSHESACSKESTLVLFARTRPSLNFSLPLLVHDDRISLIMAWGETEA